jgi:hypothetical protein
MLDQLSISHVVRRDRAARAYHLAVSNVERTECREKKLNTSAGADAGRWFLAGTTQRPARTGAKGTQAKMGNITLPGMAEKSPEK